MLTVTPVRTPTIHHPLHSKVSNYLNNQRRTGEFCDLILDLENSDTPIYCHYCVVGAQSKLIACDDFQQKSLQFSLHNPLKVTIQNFDCIQCLKTIVDFFYEDVVSIPKEHETHFRRLSKLLVITELMQLYGISETESTDSIEECDFVVTNKTENEATIATKTQVAATDDDIFNEQPNYFKLKNPRSTNSSSKVNYCIGCDFKTYRISEMISHMNNCEASHLTCSLCEIGFVGWREYDQHIKQHSIDLKKPFFCIECGLRFITKTTFLVHCPKHSTERSHLCPQCGKGFKWKQGLTSHLLTHNTEKQMLCDICGYSTAHIKSLKSHKLIHTGELYSCTYPNCKHTSNRKENMKIHIETHSQEQKYVCEICGCKFSQSKNLKRHALKHSAESMQKFKCELCLFASHRSDKLREHMQRVHTEKAVQLELPEVVENAFDTIEDDLILPKVDLDVTKLENDMEKNKVITGRIRKKKLKITQIERKIMTIAPKNVCEIIEEKIE